jgi:FixJ family two-component response regulator
MFARDAGAGLVMAATRASGGSAQVDERPVVFLVDDDEGLREGLDALFRSVGLRVRGFASGTALLASDLSAAAGCLVVDVRLPGLSGLDLQAELVKAGVRLPIIFMTGHGDIPMTVRAMKAGAVDFLEKPFRNQDMLDAVNKAIAGDRQRRAAEAATLTVKAAYDGLSMRQREVMALVAKGLMNKQIAGQLGLSEITVKQHRGELMRKMGARSLAELVRMAEALAVNEMSQVE